MNSFLQVKMKGWLMEKSEKITILSSIVLVGFVLAVIIHYVLGSYLGLSYPFNTPLCVPQEAFSDFTSTVNRVKGFAPYSHPDSWLTYFPLAYLLLVPFTFIKNQLLSYIIFASGFLTFLTCLNIKFFYIPGLTKMENIKNIFILTITSYPILYALDRGNFDMFLFVIFAGFVYLFKSKKYLLSAVLLGIQNAIKPFPLLFLLLFLFKKKYKEFFLSLLISGLLIIGSFLCFKGGFFHQITTYIQSLVIFKKLWIYNISGNGMSESSSLFGALKFLLCVYNHVTTTLVLEKLYIFIASIITMITIIFTYKEDVFWKKITLLTLNMLLVPYIIIDYKLIFLFIPIWLFVNAKEKTKLDLTYTILLGLLLIPKKIFFLWLHVEHMTQLVTYGIIINPILMLIFMGLIIYEQLSKKQKKEENEN